jgi:hypothetical protein
MPKGGILHFISQTASCVKNIDSSLLLFLTLTQAPASSGGGSVLRSPGD